MASKNVAAKRSACLRSIVQSVIRLEMVESRTTPNYKTVRGTNENAVEQLEEAANLMNSCHANLSFGLRCPEDAIRLWRAHKVDPEDAMPDQWSEEKLTAVLGYNPWLEHSALLAPAEEEEKGRGDYVLGAVSPEDFIG